MDLERKEERERKEWVRKDYKREKIVMIDNKVENGKGEIYTVKKGKRFSRPQPECQ